MTVEPYTNATLLWLEAVLAERFGHHFKLRPRDNQVAMSLEGQAAEIVFAHSDPAFRESRSDFSCFSWAPETEGFVSPLGGPIPAPGSIPPGQPLIDSSSGAAIVHYDILGLVYWMLTRKEEIGSPDLDEHQRFPATSSHAFKNGYLERPIVDEWLHVLGQLIKNVWPACRLREHHFSVKVSHDVDGPARYAFQGFIGLIRNIVGDLLIRRNPRSAILAPWIWVVSKTKRVIHPKDPSNTFDWIMDQSEKNGLVSAFYFICGRTDPRKDALYEPEMPQIRELMRRIHSRGHEIGLHPSYNTYDKPEEIAFEANRLRKVCAEEGIRQNAWGGRMHFLRWDQAITLQAWDEAGMAYDSTLSYADRPGFRCGTCFEYPAFDVINDKRLALRVRPLIAMDCTVIADRYLALGSTEEAYEKFNGLKQKCRSVDGVFTLLWHNSFFQSTKDFEIYTRLISED